MDIDEIFPFTVYVCQDVSSDRIQYSLEKPKDIPEDCITEITVTGLEEPQSDITDIFSCSKILDSIKQMRKII